MTISVFLIGNHTSWKHQIWAEFFKNVNHNTIQIATRTLIRNQGCHTLPYARHHNLLFIKNCSWILTIHKGRIFWKILLEKTCLTFKKWFKMYKPRVIMARVQYINSAQPSAFIVTILIELLLRILQEVGILRSFGKQRTYYWLWFNLIECQTLW